MVEGEGRGARARIRPLIKPERVSVLACECRRCERRRERFYNNIQARSSGDMDQDVLWFNPFSYCSNLNFQMLNFSAPAFRRLQDYALP